MPHYLILAQSEATASALGAWLELLGEKPLNPEDRRRIIWDRPAEREGAVDAYETLVRRIEVAARGNEDRVPLNQVVALVDAVRPSLLSAVEGSGSWDNLIAMLILTFPEIRWVFGVATREDKAPCWSETIEPHHSLLSLLNSIRRDPLFDPSGLRDWVRACTNDGLKAVDDLKLPTRPEMAAAIDEEIPYSYLHSYIAYRFGCRADVVTTWALMNKQFTEKGKSHVYWLLLEDMSLNFPDRESRKHLLRLADERAQYCPQLDSTNADVEKSEYRILVTGQTRPNSDVLTQNRAYLRSKAYGKGKVVLKPASGMFDLWEEAGLFRKRPGSRRIGNAPGFYWPPGPPGDANEGTGHGAPGKLLLVAEVLIRRAEALLKKVECVGEAVQGAVLATDALELTGGRTPTTAIEALSLKHRFEVLAECQFSGVEYHIKIKPRIEEIALETRAISLWFHKRQRASAVLNAQMHILNQLVRILREHNQFDEEKMCFNWIRYLHNSLWMRQKPLRFIFWPILRYTEFLLNSFGRFSIAIIGWVVVLALLYQQLHLYHPAQSVDLCASTLQAIELHQCPAPPEFGYFWEAFKRFFNHTSDPSSPSTLWSILTAIGVIAGLGHIGIFISYMYTLVARK